MWDLQNYEIITQLNTFNFFKTRYLPTYYMSSSMGTMVWEILFITFFIQKYYKVAEFNNFTDLIYPSCGQSCHSWLCRVFQNRLGLWADATRQIAFYDITPNAAAIPYFEIFPRISWIELLTKVTERRIYRTLTMPLQCILEVFTMSMYLIFTSW